MVDDLTTQPQGTGEQPPKAGGLKGFMSTTVGKIVVIGGAIAVLAAILGVVIFFVLVSLGGKAVQNAVRTPTTPGQAGTSVPSPGQPAQETTVIPVPVPNSEVFTFRDVFKSLAVNPVPSASENASGTFSGEADTLYLLDVVTDNGVRKAVLWWNSNTYTLGPAEGIPSTAWLVIEVRADSVVMLYGDSTVTLRVGQGSVAAK